MVAVNMDVNSIKISTARASLGNSNLEASGTLKDPSGSGLVQFNTSLALGELGRLLKLAARPEGCGATQYRQCSSAHRDWRRQSHPSHRPAGRTGFLQSAC